LSWRTQDWFWTLGILISIIVVILTFRLSDNQEVTDLFSFISSSVSIALALIAIFISFKQNSDNQRLTNEMSTMLVRIDEKIKTLDDKVSNLDPTDLTKITETDLKKDVLTVVEGLVNEKINNGEFNKEDLIKQIELTISEKFHDLNSNLKEYFINNNDKDIYRRGLMGYIALKTVEETEGSISYKALVDILMQRFKITELDAKSIIDNLISTGILVKRTIGRTIVLEKRK
jgi:hypothetical protein